MPGRVQIRTTVLGIDPYLAVEVARCLSASVGRPDAIVAVPAGEAAVSRRLHLAATVPPEWFTGDPGPLVSLLQRTSGGDSARILVPADLPAHRFLARHIHRLGALRTVPLPDVDTLDRLDNKACTAEIAGRCGIPQPRTIVLRSDDPAGALELEFPVICKPAVGCGGVANRVVRGASELREHVAAAAPTPQSPVVAQEWVEGDDVGVSLLAQRGRLVAWTVQRHLPRKVLRFEDHPAAVELARRLIEATGYTGVAHIDFQEPAGTRRPLLLECNPRFWASVASARHVGMNFPELAVLMAAGAGVTTPDAPVMGECGGVRQAARSLVGGRSPGAATRARIAEGLSDPLPYVHQRLSNLAKHIGANR